MTTTPRYTVRVGDDGKAYHRDDDLGAARAHARDLSLTSWSGKAQVLDTKTGAREVWQDGERTSRKGVDE